jgi:hypothetical protein
MLSTTLPSTRNAPISSLAPYLEGYHFSASAAFGSAYKGTALHEHLTSLFDRH